MPILFKLFLHQEEGLLLLLDKNEEGKTPLELLSQEQRKPFFSELSQGLDGACFNVVQDTTGNKWIEYDDGHLIRLPFPKTVLEGDRGSEILNHTLRHTSVGYSKNNILFRQSRSVFPKPGINRWCPTPHP